jgi:hypothetical protein
LQSGTGVGEGVGEGVVEGVGEGVGAGVGTGVDAGVVAAEKTITSEWQLVDPNKRIELTSRLSQGKHVS